LGRNSYEVYLTHMFVILLLVEGFNALNLNGEWVWILYISSVAISGFVGEIVARYFSNPLNTKIREYFNPALIQ